MRIAFYAPLKPPSHPVASGDRLMARQLIRVLEAAGHEVVLASELRAYSHEESVAAQEAVRAAAEAETSRLVRRWRADRHERPDLWFTYHLYYRAPDWIGPALTHAFGLAYVVAEASFASKRAGGVWSIGHEQTARALARASTVFCLSAIDRPALAKAPGFAARLVDLPPFVEAHAAPPPRAAARTGLGLAGDEPVLLAVGMMRSRAKLESYRLLAAALGPLADRPWRLAVAADGPARTEVEAVLAVLGPGRVAYLGARPSERMADVYAAADLLVWPGVGEAYGMVFLEAQAAGIPVVAMDFAGVGNVVRGGVSGALVGTGDIGAFTAAVAAFLDDGAARARLGASAKAFVREERSLDRATAIVAGALGDLKLAA